MQTYIFSRIKRGVEFYISIKHIKRINTSEIFPKNKHLIMQLWLSTITSDQQICKDDGRSFWEWSPHRNYNILDKYTIFHKYEKDNYEINVYCCHVFPCTFRLVCHAWFINPSKRITLAFSRAMHVPDKDESTVQSWLITYL